MTYFILVTPTRASFIERRRSKNRDDSSLSDTALWYEQSIKQKKNRQYIYI